MECCHHGFRHGDCVGCTTTAITAHAQAQVLEQGCRPERLEQPHDLAMAGIGQGSGTSQPESGTHLRGMIDEGGLVPSVTNTSGLDLQGKCVHLGLTPLVLYKAASSHSCRRHWMRVVAPVVQNERREPDSTALRQRATRNARTHASLCGCCGRLGLWTSCNKT